MSNDISQDFKDALSSWASGVTIVSTEVDGLSYGLTASSFSSLSLDPPLVLVCLANTNRLSSMIKDAGKFAISILADSQDEISNSFAKPGREPSSDFDGHLGPRTAQGIPVIAEAAAVLDCEAHQLIVEGDHTIAIGKVLEATAQTEPMPLIYYKRKYRTVTA